MKFGKYNVPDAWVWIAGITAPVLAAVVYNRFHADPTDIVTDVALSPLSSPALIVSYNHGPADTVPIHTPASLWGLQGSLAATAAKAALAGITRDRVRVSLGQLQGLAI
jgi:hypothetical protein